MTNLRFPAFKNHQDARCFQCDNPLNRDAPHESGYECGAWFRRCETCQMSTYYDLHEIEPQSIPGGTQ